MTYNASIPQPPEIALADALPELQAAERRLRALATAELIGYRIAAYGGFRTASDTTRILAYRNADYRVYVERTKAAGKTPVSIDRFRPIAQYGRSFHDYGAAFDVEITQAPPGKSTAQALDRLGALGAKAGLVWGGLWGNPDRPHFQLPTGLVQVRDRWAALHGSTTTNDDAAGGLAAILAAGVPGVQAIQSAAATATAPIRATAATIRQHPVVSTGVMIALALLTWVVVKRVRE